MTIIQFNAPVRRRKDALAAMLRIAGPYNIARSDIMDKKYSKYQQNIIKNYYENRDSISLQRLSELVTELYLAEGKGREKQWKYILSALEKLKLPKDRIEHLRKKDDPRLLAELVEELMAKQG
jgi:hypothetical protein